MESLKEKVEALEKGKEIAQPISTMQHVRNVVSYLNAVYYLQGSRWESKTVREKGVVIARRVS